MNQETNLCPMADRALKAAGALQMLNESGFRILSMSVTESAAFIYIPSGKKNKVLRGVSVGSTMHKCALHIVYQANLDGVLVRWFEPYFDATANQKAGVH